MLWQYLHQPAPVEKLTPAVAAGQPLDTSTATIDVLTPADVATPLPAGVPDGEVSITVLPATQPAPAAKATSPLALLLPVVEQAYAQGGPNARRMATLGMEQAEGSPAVLEAYTALRNATPETGPLTPAVLLLEISRALKLEPYVSTTTVVAETATTQPQPGFLNWLRHHLNRFVTVRHATNTPETEITGAWEASLAGVQQQLARNNPAEAALLLGQPPLAADHRLDMLRHLVAEYADLQTRLDAVRNTTLPLITGEMLETSF
jgi:hypothetical protein